MAADNARKCLRLCNLEFILFDLRKRKQYATYICLIPFPPLAHLPQCSGSECSHSARPQRLHVVLMIMDNYDGKLCKASQGGVSQLKSKGLTSTGLGFQLGVKQNWETLVETLEIRDFLERFVQPRQLQVQIIHFL